MSKALSTAKAASATASVASPPPHHHPSPPPTCDICQYRAGHFGFSLVTCKKCNVSVHPECAGLTVRASQMEHWCRACKAVGVDIEGIVTASSSHGHTKKKTVKQNTRPSECILCSVSTGVHLMHPVFHTHGKKGKHVILQNGKLAWVHTVCGLSIATCRNTAGCVYGCDIEGTYQGVEAEEEGGQGDDADDDNDNDNADVGNSSVVGTLHHFVFCNKEFPDYWRVICEHRKLKCIGCGKSDGKAWRIPVQCSAGDESEQADLKESHSHVTEPCLQAMHVGCALWDAHGRVSRPRRVFFYPGGEEEPVFEIFCPQHAQDVGRKTDSKAHHSALVRTGTHSMIGYDKPEDASGYKVVVDQQAQHATKKTSPSGKTRQKPTVVAHRGSVPTKHTLKAMRPGLGKSASVLDKKHLAASTSKTVQSRKKSSVTRATEQGKKSEDVSSGKGEDSNKLRAEGRSSNTHTQESSNHRERNSVTESTAGTGLSGIEASKNDDSSGKLKSSIPRKSPGSIETGKAVKPIQQIDASIAFPKLSRKLPDSTSVALPKLNIPKKKSLEGHRKLSSLAAAAESTMMTATASPPQTNKNPMMNRDVVAGLPPPPPYQRTSSTVGSKGHQKNSKKAKKQRKHRVELHDDDDDDDDQVYFDPDVPSVNNNTATLTESDKTLKTVERYRRRYISESKTNDEDYFDDDYDWEEAMTRDVEEAIKLAKKEELDLRMVCDARRYYWKSKSGIMGSAFGDLWNRVEEIFSHELVAKNSSEDDVMEQAPDENIVFEYNVVEDENVDFAEKNKWADMWKEDSQLYEFGDWDSMRIELKGAAAATSES